MQLENDFYPMISRTNSVDSINSFDICIDNRCKTKGAVSGNPCHCWSDGRHEIFRKRIETYNHSYDTKDDLLQTVKVRTNALESYLSGNNIQCLLSSEIEEYYNICIKSWNAINNISLICPNMVEIIKQMYTRLMRIRSRFKDIYGLSLSYVEQFDGYDDYNDYGSDDY